MSKKSKKKKIKIKAESIYKIMLGLSALIKAIADMITAIKS